MVDLSSLTDDQLKDKLLEYGIKAGPIVASTRALYEGKLHRLMVRAPVPSVNGTADAGQYSESEEEGHGDEEEDEEESGSELYGTEMASHSEPSAAASTEPVTNVLMELFPDAAVTPTGITATKRRSIKGAAGRPVQFKYPETPASPTTLARREIRQRLVPVWVQVVVFLLVAGLLYLIYVSVENSWESPFSEMLDSLSQEAVSDEDVQLIGPTEMAS